MAYINFDPFRTVEQFAKKMQNIANEVEKGVNIDFGDGFNPRVDITEDTKNVYLTFELPGVKKEDVKITINDENTLSLKGNKVRPNVNDNKDGEVQQVERTYIKIERKYGEFTRNFLMPENINKESIQAKFENGVLFVTLAKIEPVKPKEVEITVS